MKKLGKAIWFVLCIVIGWATTNACMAEVPPECWTHAFKYGQGSYGTCFYIGNGLVVTNAHVAGSEGATIVVHFRNGDEVWGKLKASNPMIDLALIEISPPKKLDAAVLAITEPKVGDEVYYVGNPYPLEFVEVRGFVVGYYEGRLMTTAISSEGASGSPLYNKQGLVVGVIQGRLGNMAISGAVPLSTLVEFLNKENKHVERDVSGARGNEAK